ncbi:MAG: 4-alpha-glucanotransferase, partial [Clostridia bacterium]|nr:4-alpha-glucanotransferase [Clostridia bacterium]
NYTQHSVVYTGTHDNDTIIGWINNASKQEAECAAEYLHFTEQEGYNWGMMKAAWECVSDTAIVTMQDLLGLDSDSRMNIPSTIGTNWKWRMQKESTDGLAKKINKYMKTYKRG